VKENSHKLQSDRHCLEKLNCLNYCVTGVISQCTAGPNLQRQKKCKYYEKATIRDQCMYYIEALNGHCDCVDAQREAQKGNKI
jgi:uncharacterized Fe-S center protein